MFYTLFTIDHHLYYHQTPPVLSSNHHNYVIRTYHRIQYCTIIIMLFISITNVIVAYRQYTTTTNESIAFIYQLIIGIEFIGSSNSSKNILLLYTVLYTNPIHCIWIRHPILSSEATAVCTEEVEKNTIIYRITTRRRRKTSTIIYRITTWSRRKTITNFCIPESIIFFYSDILLLVLLQVINCGCLCSEITYAILCYYPVFYHIYTVGIN